MTFGNENSWQSFREGRRLVLSYMGCLKCLTIPRKSDKRVPQMLNNKAADTEKQVRPVLPEH